jgi:CBS domain-containing protein
MRDDGPFHRVGNIFPGETGVESVTGDTPVVEALKIMLEKRYSQLPVMENGAVLGVFSLWSLADQLAMTPTLRVANLVVEDVVEQLPSVTVTDSLHSILTQLDQHEALLVDSPHGLQAILTSFDVFRYFYTVARPFILIQEIELALRSLIDLCAPGEKLKDCIDVALASAYEKAGRSGPTELHELAFEDYRTLILSKHNWPLFQGALGRNRQVVSAKLEAIRKIRNNVFHFRREIALLEYRTLATSREWLFEKIRRAETVREE